VETKTFLNERQFQGWCYQYFHNNYPLYRGRLFHVHQNAANIREQATLKAMGVNPGISDFILLIPYSCVFIELKYGAIQSKSQKDFQLVVESCHLKYFIIKTPEEWKMLLRSLLV